MQSLVENLGLVLFGAMTLRYKKDAKDIQTNWKLNTLLNFERS